MIILLTIVVVSVHAVPISYERNIKIVDLIESDDQASIDEFIIPVENVLQNIQTRSELLDKNLDEETKILFTQTRQSLEKMVAENSFPYLETIKNIFNYMMILSCYSDKETGATYPPLGFSNYFCNPTNRQHWMAQIVEHIHYKKKGSVPTLFFPTTQILTIQDFIQTKEYPLHFLGISFDENIDFDGYTSSPAAFFIHDFMHARESIQAEFPSYVNRDNNWAQQLKNKIYQDNFLKRLNEFYPSPLQRNLNEITLFYLIHELDMDLIRWNKNDRYGKTQTPLYFQSDYEYLFKALHKLLKRPLPGDNKPFFASSSQFPAIHKRLFFRLIDPKDFLPAATDPIFEGLLNKFNASTDESEKKILKQIVFDNLKESFESLLHVTQTFREPCS